MQFSQGHFSVQYPLLLIFLDICTVNVNVKHDIGSDQQLHANLNKASVIALRMLYSTCGKQSKGYSGNRPGGGLSQARGTLL